MTGRCPRNNATADSSKVAPAVDVQGQVVRTFGWNRKIVCGKKSQFRGVAVGLDEVVVSCNRREGPAAIAHARNNVVVRETEVAIRQRTVELVRSGVNLVRAAIGVTLDIDEARPIGRGRKHMAAECEPGGHA